MDQPNNHSETESKVTAQIGKAVIRASRGVTKASSPNYLTALARLVMAYTKHLDRMTNGNADPDFENGDPHFSENMVERYEIDPKTQKLIVKPKT